MNPDESLGHDFLCVSLRVLNFPSLFGVFHQRVMILFQSKAYHQKRVCLTENVLKSVSKGGIFFFLLNEFQSAF